MFAQLATRQRKTPLQEVNSSTGIYTHDGAHHHVVRTGGAEGYACRTQLKRYGGPHLCSARVPTNPVAIVRATAIYHLLFERFGVRTMVAK